jgi:uncharacterized protein (DUF2236 family)
MYFTGKDSIVRKIWGSPNTVLFIFAGAAAEFAVNKAVDWLYFTGRLPADPLGRLFSTVTYSHRIIFSELDAANAAIDQITNIHKGVEQDRGAPIPDWAYRDVLYMLIWYSIAAFELLHRRLTEDEKDEVFDVFYRLGQRMGLTDLPASYAQWQHAHYEQLQNDTLCSEFSIDLYKQYRKHLGAIRYRLLKDVQAVIVPQRVKLMLKLDKPVMLPALLPLYKVTRWLGMGNFLIESALPVKYKAQLKQIRK